MKVGVINRITDVTAYTYSSDRFKTFQDYPEDKYFQYEITDGTDHRAYSLVRGAIHFDAEYVAPTEDIERIVRRSIIEAMDFGREAMIDFSTENVLMGITQLGKTGGVLAVMTEQVLLDGLTKPISLYEAVECGSLYEAVKLVDYHLVHMDEYTALVPFITTERFESLKEKLTNFLG